MLTPLRLVGWVVWFGAVVSLAAQSAEYRFITVAGYPGEGWKDGGPDIAQFSAPSAIALLPNGHMLVADSRNHVIRRVSRTGATTTVYGRPNVPGYADGPAEVALFDQPTGIAVDAAGNIFVADTGNLRIRRISAAGIVSTHAGATRSTASIYEDGPSLTARFFAPTSVAVDRSGNVFVGETDYRLNALRRISPEGRVDTLLTAPRTGGPEQFGALPSGVAVDALGNVFISDYRQNVIRRRTPSGEISILQGGVRLEGPAGLAIDADGALLVATMLGRTVQRISASGDALALHRPDAMPSAPRGVIVDANGNVFIADSGTNSIRVIRPGSDVTTRFAGAEQGSRGVDGPDGLARFATPWGMALDAAGNLFIADSLDATIRKRTPEGLVTTIAGVSGVDGVTDGDARSACFASPRGIATDGRGNLFVSDVGPGIIRRIDREGRVTTIAGTPWARGSNDGVGPEARFSGPHGLAIDRAGNLFVADAETNIIRKIDPAGRVTTFAGTAGVRGSTDGTGAAASFDSPTALAIDANDNLYVTDYGIGLIRKITPSGMVTTLVDRSANLRAPAALTVAPDGNLYVVDSSTLRRITPRGEIAVLAGQPGAGGAGEITFGDAQGIAVDAAGNVFIADTWHKVLRVGSATPPRPVRQPANATIAFGQSVILAFEAPGAVKYQWQLDGVPIPEATSGEYAASYAGNYTASAMNGAGETRSTTVRVTAAQRLKNLSARAFAGAGADTLIVGFTVTGLPATTKQMLVRGVGPMLAQFGVENPLLRPDLRLHDSEGTVVARNSGWTLPVTDAASENPFAVTAATNESMQAAGAFRLEPTLDDSAVVATVRPGAYTIAITSNASTGGVGLGEIYEMHAEDSAMLTNLSARALVRRGSAVGIAGFVVSGSRPATVLMRGVGPGLTPFGVAPLSRPILTLYDAQQREIARNIGWSNAPTSTGGANVRRATAEIMQSVGAFSLAGGSADSALVATLPAGAYSITTTSADEGEGTALVEVYLLP